MLNRFKYIFLVFIALISLAGCSSYQKVLKLEDVNLKKKIADEYYAKGKYDKAVLIYEQLVTIYRGTSQSEPVYFKYAMCYFKMNDYPVASFHFKTFYETYPISESTEECYFNNAECYYKESPAINLDQSNTLKAINAYQLYIDKFSNQERIDLANQRIDELLYKIEAKSFDNAMLYYRIMDYKSASWALRKFALEYPSSKLKEVADFTSVKAAYQYALISIETKQKERFENTLDLASDFKEKYPTSSYNKDIQVITEQSATKITLINNLNSLK